MSDNTQQRPANSLFDEPIYWFEELRKKSVVFTRLFQKAQRRTKKAEKALCRAIVDFFGANAEVNKVLPDVEVIVPPTEDDQRDFWHGWLDEVLDHIDFILGDSEDGDE